jgi:peptide/nickel transport system substrate-binding protein
VRIIALLVAIIVVIGGIVVYVQRTQPPSTLCTLKSTDPLIFDQPEAPDTTDPATTFSTPGWGIVQQVYQTLVMYNQSSYTSFLPVLAKNWTVSPDHFNITFRLRSGIHFSNADPLNAYVMWFSLYRSILMNMPPEFILGQNFFFPGLNNLTATPREVRMAKAFMTTALSTWNFFSPTITQLAYMKRPDQSFQVINNLTLQVNLGYGYNGHVAYTYILATLSAPVAAAVDPAVVQAHGGVAPGPNTWMANNLLGSGPYKVQTYDPNSGELLVPDPNYWGKAAASAEPWSNILQPAKASIQVSFQGTTAVEVQDLKSGAVAGASFAYVGPSTINDLKNAPCVVVKPLDVVYSSTAGGWWIYMNQNVPPFNNLSVRKAVVHAINYDEIISTAFGGYASRWVGPVPPGYPYYNPGNLAPYAYDLALAQQSMNNSPYRLPNGYGPTINYEFINLGDWKTVATLLQGYLAKIGIKINPVAIPLDQLYVEQVPNASGICTTMTSVNGGPFPIGQEFYTSDYISPDDWTQNDAVSYGSANTCMSQYNNATMDFLVIDAAGQSNPTNLTMEYTQMSRLMYNNYTNAWLVVPQQFAVYNPLLRGVVLNPMGSGLPFTMMFNTEYAGSG